MITKQNNTFFKNLREKNNMTQEQLAEKLEINTRHLQKLEAGDRNITLTILLKLRKELNIKDNDLLNWMNEEEERVAKN